MHRHRELCAHAVDPLEIAAALETDGVTDRVAARFRHRDVFSLAEELFARAPRAEDRSPGGPVAKAAPAAPAPPPAPGPARTSSPEAGRTPAGVLLPLLAVLPGVLAAAAPGILTSAATGPHLGTDAVKGAAVATAAGLLCALVAAVCCVRWFAVRARRRLRHSRGLEEFGAGARSLLTAAVLMFACALTGLHLAVGGVVAAFAAGGVPVPGAAASVVALGLLLFVALLLAVHGFGRVAAVGLVTACALQACAAGAAHMPSAGALAARLPPAAPHLAAYGLAALWLLACAYRLLGRASSYRPRAVAAKVKPPCAAVATGHRGSRAYGEYGEHGEHGDREPYGHRGPCESCGGPPGPAL